MKKRISSWILALVVFVAMFQASIVSGQTSNVYDSNLYGVNLRIQNTLVPSWEDDFTASLPADNPNTYSIPFTYTGELK